jgi:hypothetical protein
MKLLSRLRLSPLHLFHGGKRPFVPAVDVVARYSPNIPFPHAHSERPLAPGFLFFFPRASRLKAAYLIINSLGIYSCSKAHFNPSTLLELCQFKSVQVDLTPLPVRAERSLAESQNRACFWRSRFVSFFFSDVLPSQQTSRRLCHSQSLDISRDNVGRHVCELLPNSGSHASRLHPISMRGVLTSEQPTYGSLPTMPSSL